jgi:MFS family permease
LKENTSRILLRNRIAVKISFFTNGFILANWVSRLPRIQELYSADNGTIGLVLLGLSIGAVSVMPFAGWAIIKNGSRKITLVSLIMYCIIVPLIPYMEYIPALIGLYFFMGLFTGVLDVAMNAQAVMIEQQYKKPIMTSFHAFFSIGMALGAWCSALFAELKVELIFHFSAIVLFSLIGVAWASRNLIYDKPAPSQKHDGPLFRLPNRAMATLGIITFCCMLGEGAMSEWSAGFMEKVALSGKTIAPIALSAFATAMTMGRLFGDKMRMFISDPKMIMAGGLLATVGLLVALGIATPAVSIIGFFLVGLGLSTIVPIAYSISGHTKDLPPGVGLAMVTTVGYSGFMIGPPVIGFIADWQTLRVALGVVAVLFVIMTILAFRYKQN